MKIKKHLLMFGDIALGITCTGALLFVAWAYRRQLIELVGFNPGLALFMLALLVAGLTVVAAWADIIATSAPEQFAARSSPTASLRDWILKLAYPLPNAIVLPLLLLNTILLFFAIGQVRAKEIMAKPDRAEARKITIFVGGTPLAEFPLGSTRAIRREADFAFVYPVSGLGLFRARTDGYWNPTHARTFVFENDTPIGPGHAPREIVHKSGRGAFSHWRTGWKSDSILYFSATDNNSPLENDKTYSVDYSLDLHPLLALLIVLISLPLYMRGCVRLAEFIRKLPASSFWRYTTFPAFVTIGVGLGLFMSPLFAYWETGKTTNLMIGGLLPWSDASGWLFGSYYFLNEGSLESWTTRRPVNPAFMSFLAFITGQELQTMLVLRTVLTAVACVLVAAEIWRCLGASAGIISFSVLLAYVSPLTPTTMTESLGLAFGATGFAMMWQAISKEQVWRFAAGLFQLAMAMSVRPGPFMVLPFLAAWAAFNVGTSRGNVIPRLMVMSSAVAAALALTSLVTFLFGTGASYPGANYAYTFYGLALGGKPWLQFYTDFPQASFLPEAQQSALAYRAAFAEILRHPVGLLSGLWLFFKIYLDNLFVYVEFPMLRFGCKVLACCGLVVAGYRSRRNRHLSFMFWGACGIVLSTPLLFWTMDAYRAFIPTAPFEAVLIGVGIATLIDLARSLLKNEKYLKPANPAGDHLGDVVALTTVLLAGFLALSSAIAPVVALVFYTPPRFVNANCDGGLKPFIIHLGKSSPFVEIVPDQGHLTHVPKVTNRDFHADNSFADVEISEALRRMKPGDLLIHGYDLMRGADISVAEHTGSKRFHWLIASASQMPRPDRHYLVCGQTKRLSNEPQWLQILFVETAREIMPLQD